MNRRQTRGNASISSRERRLIENFFQGNESFCDSWERFKDLTFKFDLHGLNRWKLLKCFYEGLNGDAQCKIDKVCGGSYLDKDAVELEELIEKLVEFERETNKILDNMHISLGKVTDMMQKLMTNSLVSNVQNVPCSMCFSRNSADGECVEDNMWTYGSLLASGYLKEKERLRPKLGIFWCSSLLWRQDQVHDRDHNESSITGIKKQRLCEDLGQIFSCNPLHG